MQTITGPSLRNGEQHVVVAKLRHAVNHRRVQRVDSRSCVECVLLAGMSDVVSAAGQRGARTEDDDIRPAHLPTERCTPASRDARRVNRGLRDETRAPAPGDVGRPRNRTSLDVSTPHVTKWLLMLNTQVVLVIAKSGAKGPSAGARTNERWLGHRRDPYASRDPECDLRTRVLLRHPRSPPRSRPLRIRCRKAVGRRWARLHSHRRSRRVEVQTAPGAGVGWGHIDHTRIP